MNKLKSNESTNYTSHWSKYYVQFHYFKPLYTLVHGEQKKYTGLVLQTMQVGMRVQSCFVEHLVHFRTCS
jgi:hypothetical protein